MGIERLALEIGCSQGSLPIRGHIEVDRADYGMGNGTAGRILAMALKLARLFRGKGRSGRMDYCPSHATSWRADNRRRDVLEAQISATNHQRSAIESIVAIGYGLPGTRGRNTLGNAPLSVGHSIHTSIPSQYLARSEEEADSDSKDRRILDQD